MPGAASLLLLASCCFSVWPQSQILVAATTDATDLTALNTLFTSLNSPGQLKGWQVNGGDPCGESWQGITCSGSSVTAIKLPSLGLSGNLGYNMNTMSSLVEIDMSQNSLGGGQAIQYNLPTAKLERLNLAGNQFGGNLPYSIFSMNNLKYLNLNHNQLQGKMTDVFSNLGSLTTVDLSFNSLTGDLPEGLSSLSSVKTLYLQNNQLTGSINVLADLPLSDLNVANNRFTGWIPSQLKKINSLQTDDMKPFEESTTIDVDSLASPASVGLKPPAKIERNKSFDDDDDFSSKPVARKSNTKPIKAVVYSVADLQIATDSFSMDNLVGEGTFGRVYRSQFNDGKVLAVKKLDCTVIPFQSSEDFVELVSNISILHHPNLNELVGYCMEHGQHLLVYDFHRNGSLHDLLHLSDEYSKPLSWNSRIKIALGSARALEYLHEVCSPSVVHKNFKSSNILLDSEYNPHVSDAGLASFIPDAEFQTAEQSAGCTAPEVDMTGQYTMKSDVYSFGVVMLELLTGRKPFDSSKPRSEQSLVRWASPQLHDIDALDRMVDPALKGLYPAKSLSRFADVLALCVQAEPEFRPPMSEVVQALVRLVQRANMTKKMLDGDASRRGDDQDQDFI
ncbi:Protein STRUBBELIG-RECEPTOR FAMILY 6 [Triticum urartu]|uniref:Protein kinase domain-containing protein n=2 Tax=Triticum TaxID=4564 RepID=A0A9R0VVH4_TRITD|nr:Protein STRUBBELIG-RECEPTOR FAMILY 6 [Triticum urartu]VAH86841.1 unnamed protein product [Triticum turgidum subsp. durum]